MRAAPFYVAKRPDKYYLLRFDPGAGTYEDVKFRRAKIVTTRADHECCGCGDKHVIPAGRRVWRESAVVDGRFGTCYADLECLDRWFDEVDPLAQAEGER